MAVLFSWAGAGLATTPFNFTTSIGTGDTAFSGVYGTSSKLQVVADGLRPARFAVDDSVASPAAAVWSPANNLTRGTVYRIEIVATGASAAVYVYAGDSATALYASGAQAIGSGLGTLRIGENDSSNMSGKKYDDIVVTDTASLIGPAAVQTTVSAGTDQTAIEPFSTVSLTATVVTGSVSSWVWSQLSGPSGVLSGSGATRTFSAPATTATSTLVFQVVGDGGPSAQVSVQVLPQLDWLKTVSGLQALRSGN